MSSHGTGCFQNAPPSAAMWTTHKATIIELYGKYPLRHVRKVMEEQYGFRASKRMYDRRLKDWQVTKYLKAKDKDKIADLLAQTGTWLSRSSSPNMGLIQIDEDDYRKVLRHLKAKKNIPSPPRSTDISRDSHSHKKFTKSVRSSNSTQASRRTDWVVLPSEEASPALDSHDSPMYSHGPRTIVSGSWSTPKVYPDISNPHFSPATSFDRGESLVDDEDDEYFAARMFSAYPDSASPSTQKPDLQMAPLPLQLISHDKNSLNIELVLRSVEIYLDHLTQPTMKSQLNRSSQALVNTSQATTQLWDTLKDGIYLLKVKSPELAWPALDNACNMACTVLADPSNLDFWFLREIFLTLSPVNTKIFPVIRTVLLQYFRYLMCWKISPIHPIAAIFHELQQDNQDREVSEKALACMFDGIQAKFGDHDPNGVAFKLKCSMITLLRRDGDLETAAAEARYLFEQSRCRLLEARAYSSSDDSTFHLLQTQARAAASELAHVLMDQRGSYRAEAVQMSMYVLLGESKAWTINYREASSMVPLIVPDIAFIQDKKSMYAMEDLAKTYEELEKFDIGIEWLRRARVLAQQVLGSEAGTTTEAHIVEKINRLMVKSNWLG